MKDKEDKDPKKNNSIERPLSGKEGKNKYTFTVSGTQSIHNFF
jgi:hypothetical protein